ncbi:ParB/RepB/Spo0J family partition protein [Chlamydia sp. 17-3921]|uniref:ParB/RepB/Spo0J family partition protein n=1 Tax=Chlamydia sp. 17-3921 TaxID=2675798 RepID=UPI00191AC14E|nr:ParB/RepB/Spo0J family partition protein [Chlamydia sp. 17-3921]
MSIEQTTNLEGTTDSIIEVAIESIRVSPFQPRKIFSDEELNELVVSLKSVGLIHPPVVREICNGDQILYYELIAGERRWRAMQKAGYKTIPVVLKQIITDNVAAEATLIENIQRVNLNPIEMAEAFKRLIHVFGLTQDKVACKVGKKRSTIANYLRLLTLSESIQKSVCLGEITLGHAKVILTLEDPVLREKLREAIVQEGLAVRETEVLAKALLKCDSPIKEMMTQHTKSYQNTEKYHDLQKHLSEHCGYNVKIKPLGEGMSVSFHLKSSQELDALQSWLLRE